MLSQQVASVIPYDRISVHIAEIEKLHPKLVSNAVQGIGENAHEQRRKSEEENTKLLKAYNRQLSNDLMSNNVLGHSEVMSETNIEQILEQVVFIQNKLKNQKNTSEEVKNAIWKLKNEKASMIKGPLTQKISTLVDQFIEASESVSGMMLGLNITIDKVSAINNNNLQNYQKEIKLLEEKLTDAQKNAEKLSLGCVQDEEMKEIQAGIESQQDTSDQHLQPKFSFYNDLYQLKQKSFQVQQNIQHQIVHPFEQYKEDTAIENMNKILVTIEKCTTLNNEPHGLVQMKWTNSANRFLSFTGLGFFNQGKLDNFPFVCVNLEGSTFSFSMMRNGRPADGSYMTSFNKNGETQHVDSLMNLSNVAGWQNYSGQIDKEMRKNGQGKKWDKDGSIYIGQYKHDKKIQGSKYILVQARDGTVSHTQREVTYDEDEQELTSIQIGRGLNMI